MKKPDASRERVLLLRYACERVARSLWKTGWRQIARYMERAALFEALGTAKQREAMQEHRTNVIFNDDLREVGP